MSKSSEIHWCCFCQKTSENKDIDFMIAGYKNGEHGICSVCLGIASVVGAKKNKVWAKKLMLKLIDTWDSKER